MRAAARWCSVVLTVLVGLSAVHPLVAQDPATPDSAGGDLALRVFLDCQSRFCDEDFFQIEVPFVNYTRFREDSQLHLLITSQVTGSGGFLFTLDFIGREEFEGMDDQLEVVTEVAAAEEQVLDAIAQGIKLGVVRYVARTPVADQIDISFRDTGPAGERAVATAEEDPWNFWTFRVGGRGTYFAEERQNFFFVNGSVSANRTTESLKLRFSLNGGYSESNFDIDSVTTVTNIQRNYDAFAFAAWSLGDHWSLGGSVSATHATFTNQDLTLRVASALEFNLFPYVESTRRLLTFSLSAGLSHFNWIDETIFFNTSEVRPDSRLAVSLDVKQPWGQAGGAVEAVVWLDDPSQNSMVVFGNLELRIIRGFNFELRGSAARVRDQFNLPAGEATPEEILLRQRQLLTGFRYNLSIGFNYSFGSIFSNVVNPRFGGSSFGFVRAF